MTTKATRQVGSGEVYEAILDLTRVTLAVSGKFASKNEAIRKLAELSIPPSRIAALLAVPLSSVTSALAKARKNGTGRGGGENLSSDSNGE